MVSAAALQQADFWRALCCLATCGVPPCLRLQSISEPVSKLCGVDLDRYLVFTAGRNLLACSFVGMADDAPASASPAGQKMNPGARKNILKAVQRHIVRREQSRANPNTAPLLPDQVDEGLFVSDEQAAANTQGLLNMGIGLVVVVASSCSIPPQPNGATPAVLAIIDGVDPGGAFADALCHEAETFCRARRHEALAYVHVKLEDSMTQDLMPHLEGLSKLIHAVQPHAGVLVHCVAGASRSVSVVAAHMLLTRRVASLDEALKQIQRARPAANPNTNFRLQLLRLQRALDAVA